MQKHAESNQVVFHLIYHVLVFVVEMLVALLVVFGIVKCCQTSYRFCYEIFGSVSVEEEGPGADRDFEVKKSESVFQMAERLQEGGIIKNKYSFYARIFLMEHNQAVFRPGQYILNTSMDYEDIINVLTMSE